MIRITFQAFWDAYALKRDRIAAERAWKKLSARDRQAAFAGIGRYDEDCKKRGISKMYAQGYISHRRWEDEVADVEAQNDAGPLFASAVECTTRPVRCESELTDSDNHSFLKMKRELQEAWDLHRDEPNKKGLLGVLEQMRLRKVNEPLRMIEIQCSDYAVKWFWKPGTFDAVVAKCFFGYRWRAVL